MHRFSAGVVAGVAAAFGIGGFGAAIAWTQEGPAEPPAKPAQDEWVGPGVPFKMPTQQELAAQQQKFMATTMPGLHHKRLAWYLGDWDMTSQMTMGGQAGPKTPGTANFRWLLEGRWLLLEAKGTIGPMPVTAYEIIGYDNYRKEYVTAGVNSMTTSLQTAAGTWGRNGKVLQMFGKMDEPMDDTHKTVRFVTRILGPDQFVQEIHDTHIGETGTKVLQFTYTRKKKQKQD